MGKIDKAVSRCIQQIAMAQQNVAAIMELSYRLRLGNRCDEVVDAALSALSSRAHKDLADAWAELAWFAPISKEAIELLGERTRTWFEREDTEVMRWLGESGSYYVKDKEKFRAEVLAMFGCEEE